MRQSLRLTSAMLKQAEAKVTRDGNAELAVTTIDNFWDHLLTSISTTADAVSLTHLLHSLQIEIGRDQNMAIDLYVLINIIVGVFKPAEESGETIHVVLMANHVPDELVPRLHFEHAGVFTDAKGHGGASGKRKAEPSTPKPSGKH